MLQLLKSNDSSFIQNENDNEIPWCWRQVIFNFTAAWQAPTGSTWPQSVQFETAD